MKGRLARAGRHFPSSQDRHADTSEVSKIAPTPGRNQKKTDSDHKTFLMSAHAAESHWAPFLKFAGVDLIGFQKGFFPSPNLRLSPLQGIK
jgi:hypothetical protein